MWFEIILMMLHSNHNHHRPRYHYYIFRFDELEKLYVLTIKRKTSIWVSYIIYHIALTIAVATVNQLLVLTTWHIWDQIFIPANKKTPSIWNQQPSSSYTRMYAHEEFNLHSYLVVCHFEFSELGVVKRRSPIWNKKNRSF